MGKGYVRLYPIDIARMPWEPVPGGAPGTSQKILALDPRDGSVTRFLKAEPGTKMGIFVHEHWEEVWIVEGSARLSEEYHPRGTFTCKPPGIEHGPIWTLEGFVNLEFRDYLSPEVRKPFARWYPMDIEQMSWERGLAGIEGFWVKNLACDPQSGSDSILWRAEPGVELPSRSDNRFEETYILDGSCKIGEEYYPTGTYVCRPPGMAQGAFYTHEGVLGLSIRNSG